jgi:hypothetical protein
MQIDIIDSRANRVRPHRARPARSTILLPVSTRRFHFLEGDSSRFRYVGSAPYAAAPRRWSGTRMMIISGNCGRVIHEDGRDKYVFGDSVLVRWVGLLGGASIAAAWMR